MAPVSSLSRRPVTALVLVLALSACGAQMPGPRAMGPAVPQFAPPPPMAGVGPAAQVSAGLAEAACADMARAQGLGVQSVVGTREVAGPDGMPQSRDVMLRVTRGQMVYDVRCNYSYSADAARIMSL